MSDDGRPNDEIVPPATTQPATTQPATKHKVNIKDLPDLLTIKEVSELLRVSPLTLKRWGKRGKLPAIRINSRGDRRYKRESVLALLGMMYE